MVRKGREVEVAADVFSNGEEGRWQGVGGTPTRLIRHRSTISLQHAASLIPTRHMPQRISTRRLPVILTKRGWRVRAISDQLYMFERTSGRLGVTYLLCLDTASRR